MAIFDNSSGLNRNVNTFNNEFMTSGLDMIQVYGYTNGLKEIIFQLYHSDKYYLQLIAKCDSTTKTINLLSWT